MNQQDDAVDIIFESSADNLIDPLKALEQIQNYSSGLSWLPTVKIIAGVISAFLFSLIVLLVIKSNQLWKVKMAAEGIRAVEFPKKFDKKWQAIVGRMEKGDDANMKLAIIEADKLFDGLLQQMGYEGKDMGGRLEKLSTAQLSNLEDIWLAHKVRNRIVHEAGHQLTPSEAESAIDAFEKAFKEWQVL